MTTLASLKTASFFVGTIFLITTLSVHHQWSLSNIDNLGDVTNDWTRGEGLKAATMFKISNQDGELGNISESDACDVDISSEISVSYEKLNCGTNPASPIHGSAIRTSQNGESSLTVFWIGGRQ